MSKIDYTKSEIIMNEGLYRYFMQNLYDLSAIATQAQEGMVPLDTKMVDEVLKTFRVELLKMKKNHLEVFNEMGLTEVEEKRLLSPPRDFGREDWLRILELKEKMMVINSQNMADHSITVEDELRVAKERKEHLNKRFHIKKNWLPLH